MESIAPTELGRAGAAKEARDRITERTHVLGMNPLRSVARLRLWERREDPTAGYLGTCFSYRWQNRLVTAAHCVAGLEPSEVAVETPWLPGFMMTALEIHRHPTADIAVLETGGIQVAGAEVQPFWGTVGNWSLGEKFFAYGYPVDVLGPSANLPTPRLFTGYFQRFMQDYEAYTGYRYLAGEMSFACPAGLSGGPLFRPGAQVMVVALATENLKSATTLESFEERTKDGKSTRVEYREVISYGTALMLSNVSDWLDSYCPPRESYIVPASLAHAGPHSPDSKSS